MNYLEFQKEILEIVKKIAGSEYQVSLHRVVKNNDVELVAILIEEKAINRAVPTIYLDDYYEMYSAGVELYDIANSIFAIYLRQRGMLNLSIEDFMSYESIKDKIMLKIINYERNIEGLKDTPHRRVLDLAIVYYVLWEQEDGQRMTTTIRNSHLNMWDIEALDLYDLAYTNTIKKLSVDIRSMKEVVHGIYCDMLKDADISKVEEEELLDELTEERYPMYVVTNKYRTLGAAVMLYEPIMKYIYEKFEGKYYVLPSSVHEFIAVPKADMTVDYMKNMVTEINENEVEYQEVLSDNVYCYDGKELALAM